MNERIVNMQLHGEEYPILFVKDKYTYNDNLAIQVMCKGIEEYLKDEWVLLCSLTVNLPEYNLDDSTAFLDVNNCSPEIIQWLNEHKKVKMLGVAQSGYVQYPLVIFEPAFLNNMAFTMEEYEQFLDKEREKLKEEDDFER